LDLTSQQEIPESRRVSSHSKMKLVSSRLLASNKYLPPHSAFISSYFSSAFLGGTFVFASCANYKARDSFHKMRFEIKSADKRCQKKRASDRRRNKSVSFWPDFCVSYIYIFLLYLLFFWLMVNTGGIGPVPCCIVECTTVASFLLSPLKLKLKLEKERI